MARLQLSKPDAYREFLQRNYDELDVIIKSMKNDLLVHEHSNCNPKRIRYIKLCLEMAQGVRDGRL